MSNLAQFQSNLKQLVKTIAYQFYSGNTLYVLSSMIDMTEPETLDTLSSIFKLRSQNLSASLEELSKDGFVSSFSKLDSSIVPPGEKLTEARIKKYTKLYYFLDYAGIIDCVRLKIILTEKELEKQCGAIDSIHYLCPTCKRKFHLDQLYNALNEESIDEGFKCPECSTLLENLKDDEEIDRKKILLKKFRENIKRIFDLTRGFEAYVFEDDPECRSDLNTISTRVEYERKKRLTELEKGKWSERLQVQKNIDGDTIVSQVNLKKKRCD